ncbi:MAG: hypothetical protein ACPG4T_11900 [Nannocystaceae bacterium]
MRTELGHDPAHAPKAEPPPPVTDGQVVQAWWPLAASWILMAVEQPLLAIVVARLANLEVNLAAWGGVVFPLALLIEAPVIMMLAASTALSRDRASYRALRRITHGLGFLLTVAHILLAFTPLYDIVVGGWMGIPDRVLLPGQIGLMVMTLWTWAIASRRFNQGILIRFGHSRAVGVGTAVRLVASTCVFMTGLWYQSISGIIVASTAVVVGVLVEAVYIAWRVRPDVQNNLAEDTDDAPLTGWKFAQFYFPLSMTVVIPLLARPLGSSAIARMPLAVASLAVWPVIEGLVFVLQAGGIAYNEVVIAHLERPNARAVLRRVAWSLAVAIICTCILLAATPIAQWWFHSVNNLPERLASMASAAIWFALPVPILRPFQSWFQGVLVHVRKTRAITESVGVFFVIAIGILWSGVHYGFASGLVVTLSAFALGYLGQTTWLWVRSRPYIAALPS